MKTKVVSFRVTPEDVAKALDGLLANPALDNNFTSISQIVRTTFYLGIISMCNNASKPPTQESMDKILQLMNQNKIIKPTELKDLLKDS